MTWIDQAPFVSVVVPAYNEAPRLVGNVERITVYLDQRDWDYEVLVVDDGSDDGTAEFLCAKAPRLRLLRHERNQGKGAAVRTGVLASRGEWILITDADLSTPIEELPKLLAEAGSAEVIFGSRAVAGSQIDVRQPRRRELLGRLFNRFIRGLGITKLHDTQCGFKLVRGDVARRLFPRLEIVRYAFDVELVWGAERAGYRVREVGVVWRDSARSTVRPWRDGLAMVTDVLRLRLRRQRTTRDARSAGRLPRDGTR